MTSILTSRKHPAGSYGRAPRAALGVICFLLAWLAHFELAPSAVHTSSSGVSLSEARADDDLKTPTLDSKADKEGEEKKGAPGAPAAGKGAGEKEGGATAKGADGHKSLSVFPMIMSAIAGLVLFIFGVTQLAKGLGDMNSERMRRVTSKFTTNRFAGVATGFVATTLLESSSVTIIMVIAMVSGGILTFVQSLGVVLGANIGTAVGAQIIALDTEQYVPLLMLSGLLLLLIGKSETRHKLGIILLGFGLMFYGLAAIDGAMKPLRSHEPTMELMRTLGDNPWLGALAGALLTVVIQSSSATVAIVITLAGSELISLPAGVAIMLGAEIGTCSDTLVATVGRGRPAIRTGVFHLVFNLLTAGVALALAPFLIRLVESISGGASVGRQIANAQMVFNLTGVALVLPFLPAIARALEKAIPDAREQRDQPAEGVPAQ